jgi:putative transposase
MKQIEKHERKSHMRLDEIYFWTATINQWQRLLWPDDYKDVIISSLEYLTEQSKIDVFGFVIMPNHLHFIWKMLDVNGKETAQASFLKYTAHQFRNMLLANDKRNLVSYRVDAENKTHEFWQRDPLATPLYTRKVAYQKLDYIHYNPLAEHWKLVTDPCDYRYSSARYYETGDRSFLF